MRSAGVSSARRKLNQTTLAAKLKPLGRPCKVCTNPARDEIDHALLRRETSLAGIGRTYGVAADALHRHMKNHLERRLVGALQAEDHQRQAADASLLSFAITQRDERLKHLDEHLQ